MNAVVAGRSTIKQGETQRQSGRGLIQIAAL